VLGARHQHAPTCLLDRFSDRAVVGCDCGLADSSLLRPVQHMLNHRPAMDVRERLSR
jgi:hypothetical protein